MQRLVNLCIYVFVYRIPYTTHNWRVCAHFVIMKRMKHKDISNWCKRKYTTRRPGNTIIFDFAWKIFYGKQQTQNNQRTVFCIVYFIVRVEYHSVMLQLPATWINIISGKSIEAKITTTMIFLDILYLGTIYYRCH